MSKPGFTLGPWFSHRTDWRGDPVEHKIYISGNEHETYEDDEDDDEYGAVTGSAATAVCIVEGNATSRGVTEANARLIAAAPELLTACEAALRRFGHEHWESVHDAAAIEALRAAVAKTKGETQ